MKRNTIECAEALAYLKTLPDCAVHCIVTSPPYFGLRDYSTGTWEGGDPACDHRETRALNATSLRNDGRKHQGVYEGEKALVLGHVYRNVCQKCGATRIDQQLGLESTPEAYITRLVEIFREARRVLRNDGTLWIVIGDSYWNSTLIRSSASETFLRKGEEGYDGFYAKNGGGVAGGKRRSTKHPYLKPKDLIMIPAQLAIALSKDGWYLRDEIVWEKGNGMPSSVVDRITRSHEMIYTLSKKRHYWYDQEAIKQPSVSDHGSGNGYKREPRLIYQNGDGTPRGNDTPWEVQPMANCRSVWKIATVSGMEGHYATFPPKLAERMILAGCPHKTCAKCGAPWVREYEKTGHVNGREPAHAANNTPTKVDSTGWKPTWRLTGNWKPTCKCETTETVPGIVLDFFMGSGTTARVAVNLGRDFLGCDLNPDYVEKALKSLERGIQMPLLEVLQA